MKTIRLCFYLFVSVCSNSLFAQEVFDNGMLFPRFENGIVVFKSGLRSPVSLNYNMILQQMLFLRADSTIMEIIKPLDILVVIIGERRFVPVSSKGVFYEEIQAGKGSFFVRRNAVLISEGKAAGYGGYSQTSSVSSLSSWIDDKGASIALAPDEKFRIDIQCIYYLKSGNKYKRFFSAKTLGKLFKTQASEIKKFANKQSINFSKMDDVARIVEYGYNLSPNS